MQTDIEVSEYGKGDNTLLLLHPFPVHHEYFNKLSNYLPDGWRVILPDLPGCGQSPPLEDEIITMKQAAELMFQCLPDNFDQLVIGGVSMGGYITMALLQEFKPAVSAVILANTRDQADLDGGAGRQEVVKMIDEGRREKYVDGLIPKLIAERNREDEELLATIHHLIAGTTDQAIKQYSLGMGQRQSSREFLATQPYPILLITGDQDKITGVEVMTEMHEAYSNSRFKIIPKAGHFAFLENSETSSRIIHEFLSSL